MPESAAVRSGKNTLIRQRIIALYIKLGAPVPVHGLAANLGLSNDELQRELAATSKLGELGSLRIEQAEELIRFMVTISCLRRTLLTRSRNIALCVENSIG
jgi:hypothetical protein